MAKEALCPACHKPLQGATETYRKRVYHADCLNAMVNAARAKDATASAKFTDPDLQSLLAYLRKQFKVNDIPPRITTQIKNFKDEGISYGDMHLALHYFYDLCGHAVDTAGGIGIVPYVLQEAKDFNQRVKAADAFNRAHIPQEEERVVHLDTKDWTEPLHYSMKDL